MSVKMTHEVSSSSRWKYDVFLSFCGKDTRKNFTDHLFTALVRDGIHVFRDDEELKRGADISSELMDAIEGSRIAIVVFSENYASSTWCLEELVKILKCQKNGQTVLPVFYKVDPSVVRHKKRTFEEAFVRHAQNFKEEMGKVETWKAALKEAANLSGWDQSNVANGNESELIKVIAKEVSTILNQPYLNVATYPVGLDSHAERISCLLEDGLDIIHFLGIYGLGGIGKTTIAKAVFNDMFSKFEGSSFLNNVREASSQQNGLSLLQKRLLSDVLKKKYEEIDINNDDRGIIMIKKSLCFKRVLIVLDDVDEMRQLEKLVGHHDWFGPGSRIIITTRDEHLLNMPEVNKKYRVETLNQYDSLQLFSFHAFRQNHPLEGFAGLSNDVIKYASGLPLALVILGSLLSDKRSQDEWESELEKMRKIPDKQILKTLEISYYTLDDFTQNIFLDISCFFVGEFKHNAIEILDACGLHSKAGIRLLIERSLVTINEWNQLCMHDLIRDMGREIVRKQSPRKPEERTRLWQHDDALDVLRNLTGTDAVEGLVVDLSMYSSTDLNVEKLQLTTNAFFKMPNLRLLRIDHRKENNGIDWENCNEGRNILFKHLVWLHWRKFPFKHLPNNFHLGNLVILDMQESQELKEVWKGTKHLPKLKVLDLNASTYLTCTPDFSGVLNLEKLILSYCSHLVEVHESIGLLSKLVKLDLLGCTNLRKLPSSICNLASLETLNISQCEELDRLPEGIGNLTRLSMLDVTGTAIGELPSSLGFLKNLTWLSYSQERGEGIRNPKSAAILSASLYGFCSLKSLYLNDCNLTDDDIPDDLWKSCSLEDLSLCGNQFLSHLPSSICDQFSELEHLQLLSCTSLKSLPKLPSSLRTLDASECRSLERLPNLSNLKHLRYLNLSFCLKLNEIEGLDGLECLEFIELNGCNNLKSFADAMLPSSLHSLKASRCRALERLPNMSNLKHLKKLDLSLCEKLNEIEGLEGLQSVETINLNGCNNLRGSINDNMYQVIYEEFGNRNICDIFLPGTYSRQRYAVRRETSSASCQVVALLPNMEEIQGVVICVVYVPLRFDYAFPEVVVHNQSKNYTWNRTSKWKVGDFKGSTDVPIWMIKIPGSVWKSIAECGDIINVSVKMDKPGYSGKQIALHTLHENKVSYFWTSS